MSSAVAETGAEAVTRFVPLTEEAIAAQTDHASFTRGRTYFRQGRIFDTVLRGNTLRAQCEGSAEAAYIVQATLVPAGETPAVAVFACDCPRGGFCKHVVALLLTWLHHPERFAIQPPIAALLAGKSREELIALVELFLDRAPELDPLLELPVPGVAAATAAVNPETVRRQVANAFRRVRGDEWGAAGIIADSLSQVRALGDAYAAAGRRVDAATLYATFAAETLEHFVQWEDHEGEIAGEIIEAERALAAMLNAEAELPEPERWPAETRTLVIRALYDIWRRDIMIGSIGLAQEGPEAIASQATSEERATVTRWLEGERPSDESDFMRDWERRAINGFILMLKEHAGLSDEELLAEYQRLESWPDVASALLRLGRVEEATATAARHLAEPRELTRFANELIALGGEHVAPGRRLVEDRLWETEGKNAIYDDALRTWLVQHYATHNLPEKALALQRRRFAKQPSFASYQAVEEVAHLPGQPSELWANLRPELIAALRAREDWASLVEVHLKENEVGAALAALARYDTGRRSTLSDWGWYAPDMHVRVAQAAEREFPEKAIGIYTRLADGLIAQRNRGSYSQAAQHLAAIRRVMVEQGQEAGWRERIAALREEHKRLRALQDELNQAGLE